VKNKKESFFIALFNSWKCSNFIRILSITHHQKEKVHIEKLETTI
jgi:hypothetical protein